jgi:hypothetical protein
MNGIATAPLADGAGDESAAEIRHRTLTELRRTVRHHPAVADAYAVREGTGRFRDLHVEFVPEILGIDAEEAGLRVEWRPRPGADGPAFFVFHYHDSSGRDFGWHHEPNPHVEGLAHFQHRDDPDAAYTYEAMAFESDSPVELLWELLGRIEERM